MSMLLAAPETSSGVKPRNVCPHFFETTVRRYYCWLTDGHVGEHTVSVLFTGTARHPNGRCDPHATAAVTLRWVAPQ